jgi:hypothetical protein
MYGKFVFLISVVLVLGLAGGVSAADKTWNNGDGDNMWCNDLNWSPAGRPLAVDNALITSTPNDAVIVASGCVATCTDVDWDLDANNQTFTIEAGGSLDVLDNFAYDDGDFNAVLNIWGDLTIDADQSRVDGNGRPFDYSFRAPDSGSATVNIYDGANVWCSGAFRGADSGGSSFNVYMTGGDVNCLLYKHGDDGDGDFIMTGGKFTTRRPGGESFTIRGRGGNTEFNVLIGEGAELWVAGNLMTPQESEAKANVILDGKISCDEWTAQGPRWVVDINDSGELRIRDSDGTTKAAVDQWILDEQIIGKGGAKIPQITWDGPDLVLTIEFVHKTAYAPDPPDDAENVCPDANLIWSPGVYVTDHNIYFGTDMNEVNEVGVPKAIHWGPNEWDPGVLALNTTYYWRIDTVNDACAPYKWEGGIWSLTTSDGNAFAVFPEDGETGVAIDSNLVWNACEYTSFDVYFSLDFNEVNDRNPAAFLGNTGDTTIDPCAGDLTPSRTYYWAVDKYVGPVKSEGDVWNFRSKPDIVDVDMIAWYKLDEGIGDDAFDSSGYEHHADADTDDENWDPNDGHDGGSLLFDNDSDIELPLELTSDITDQMTVSVWLKDSHRPGDDNWVFGWGDDDGSLFAAAVVSSPDQEVYFRAGNDTNDVLTWDMGKAGFNPATLADWHHWVFVKNESSPEITIYFDAEVAETNDVVAATLADIVYTPGKFGAVPWHGSDLVAKMDDVRVYKKALNAGEVEALFRGGDVGKAWKPDPSSGATDVDRNVELSWRSGNYATHHDVYFGKNRASVRDANLANQLSVYQQRQVVSDTNDAPGILELGETYYWRIDEVNETNNPDDIWKGDVWSFTVAPYVTVDDFEAYDTTTNKIFNTWQDGNINLTGSFLDLGAEPFNEAHGGFQSMLYVYDNTILWDWDHYWSEAALPFDPAMDWTDAGVKVLTLYFYGDPGNDANDTEELYVGVTGSLAEVRYTDDAGQDNNDIRLAEWTEWNIPISDFNNPDAVDPCAVTSLLIGFGDRDNTDTVGGEGVVYFDDIRLHPPRCVPQEVKPDADLNNDCIVSWGDIEVIGAQWLRGDANLAPVSNPGTANLVGHWELDDGSGTTATDSTANANHGTIEGDVAWIAGRIGSDALDFIDGRVLVPDDNNTPELRPTDEVSATVWAYYSTGQGNSNRVLVKGSDNAETYGIEIDDNDDFVSYVRDVNGDRYDNESGAYRNEWMHLAMTYDGASVKSYINGLEVASRDEPNLPLSQDNAGLAIGNRSDATDRSFEGKADDARVYNRGLTAGEIGYLASEGTGEVLLDSEANLYSGESPEVINIRDVAVLLETWLEQKLWPE